MKILKLEDILTDDEIVQCVNLNPIQIAEIVLRPKFNKIQRKAEENIDLMVLGQTIYNAIHIKLHTEDGVQNDQP